MSDKKYTEKVSPLEPFVGSLVGPGGTRAILASSIMYAVLDWVGIHLDRAAGVSGGAPGAALYISGISGKEVLKLGLDLDFGALVTFHHSPAELIAALRHGWKQWQAGHLPHKAIISTLPLGQKIKDYTRGVWPPGFWTVAITQEGRLILTPNGIWEMSWCGCIKKLTDRPCGIDVALAATTAIPGIMHGVPINIGDRELIAFDGGIGADPLSLDARRDCPADLAMTLFGRHRLFVFDVGPDLTYMGRIIAGLRQKFINTPPVPATPEWVLEDEMVTVIDCPVTNIPTLKLGPSRDFKWSIIMKGFDATIATLQAAQLLKAEKVAAAHAINERYKEISVRIREEQSRAMQLRGKKARRNKLAEIEGSLSPELEALMREHDLYPAAA